MKQGGITVQSLSVETRRRLAAAGVPDPMLEARLMIGEIIGFSLTDFVLKSERPLSNEELLQIEQMVSRREKGEPVHRILGHREFYGLDLLLSAETLEPRPDTEVLVDGLLPYLSRIAKENGSVDILDMGIGTGAICLALLSQCEKATGVGSDVSQDAMRTARKNAERHGLEHRFKTVESDWFENITGCFDIIVSNPPYIKSDVIPMLERDVRDFDPVLALDGGHDGLAPYRMIAADASRFLKAGGVIGLEIGHDQRDDVSAIFLEKGYERLETIKDYGGNDRALVFAIG